MDAAIIGGTGNLGYGLALRLASAGLGVVIGSRDPERARGVAAQLTAASGRPVAGAGIVDAAARAPVVVLAVPAQARFDTAAALKAVVQGKVVVDTTVALAPGDPTRVALPAAGASVLELAALLGPGVRLAAAFHSVSGKLLAELARPLDGDVLICADDPEAGAAAARLVEAAGARPLQAGPLENGSTLERLTALIIGMNKRYKRRHIGVRFTGL